ncbi:hypothetical protein BP5796_11137 [Coleophoma crateriformis]|uniref:Zn(2)-C6 fungal-type domain-containing protein n=1 Tax=Coleophoma crateriformis TaxID=565419 RepID=A0A3D8QM12_9HELO|nr:hypothetical protein BP5796_11137 [Coleophoma crateriformis]
MSEQAGPVTRRKKQYKKSRQGCVTCKNRRVKCDEAHPVCGPCAKLFVDKRCCEYESRVKPTYTMRDLQPRFILPSGQQSPSQPVVQRPSGVNLGQPSHLLELQLMHHYTKVTCSLPKRRSFPPCLPGSSYPLWEVYIPQIAFTSELVLSALLAVSSLHLSASSPNDPRISQASSFYIDKTLRLYRATISDEDPEHVDVIFATAILLVHITWLSSHSIEDCDPFSIENHLQTFHLCKGLKLLSEKLAPRLIKSDVFANQVQSQPKPKQTPGMDECQYPSFREIARQDLANLSTHFDHSLATAEDIEIYKLAAEDLTTTLALVSSGLIDVSFIEQEIASLLHRLPPRFVEMLREKDPIALALLARTFALLKIFDDDRAWWFHGVGEKKVAQVAVNGIASLMPSERFWMMDFPLKIIRGELKLEA